MSCLLNQIERGDLHPSRGRSAARGSAWQLAACLEAPNSFCCLRTSSFSSSRTSYFSCLRTSSSCTPQTWTLAGPSSKQSFAFSKHVSFLCSKLPPSKWCTCIWLPWTVVLRHTFDMTWYHRECNTYNMMRVRVRWPMCTAGTTFSCPLFTCPALLSFVQSERLELRFRWKFNLPPLCCCHPSHPLPAHQTSSGSIKISGLR